MEHAVAIAVRNVSIGIYEQGADASISFFSGDDGLFQADKDVGIRRIAGVALKGLNFIQQFL